MSRPNEKTCIEDPKRLDTRKTIQSFEKKFSFFVVFAVLYGLVFLNYIDVMTPGGVETGYHAWLSIMYFFPFIALTLSYPRNWLLTIGLGLVASLMNDVFYGVVRNLIAGPYDLTSYYTRWLIPGGTTLFHLNLGFTIIPVQSWMMALFIYARIPIVILLLWAWKGQAKIRCLNEVKEKQSVGLPNWWRKEAKLKELSCALQTFVAVFLSL